MARKKNTYRLQIVLDRKEEARDEAARYLAECREKLRREQEEEARLREELRVNRDRRQEETERMVQDGLSGGLDVNGAQSRLNFMKRLDREAKVLDDRIEEQKKKVKRAEQEVEDALQALVQASRELQVMEKHKERWQKQMKKQQDIAEQKEMNEIGDVMYLKNRRDAEKSL